MRENAPRARIDAWLFGVAVVAAVVLHAALYLPRFAADVTWGDDYALHFPNLLAGCYWLSQNGPFAVPWFSPAQCGGIPFLGDLNVAYYSVPQWLAFAFGPLPAVRVTFVLFAALGAAGFHLLLRARFAASHAAAAAGAVLVLFNTFYSARMLSGHLTFHPFVLVPWIAWAALAPVSRVAEVASRAVLCGAAFAYMFHAGMVHGILPALVAVAAVVLLHGQRAGHARGPWIVLLAAIPIALALGAQRLAAALAFLAHFPRADYEILGFLHLVDAAHFPLRALFWLPALSESAAFANKQWDVQSHELAFGIGPAALLCLLAGAYALGRRGAPVGRAWAWIALLAVLSLPVLLNWHYEPWTAFLKRLPLFGSSVTLLRWYALYIPIAALLAALALDTAARPPLGRRLGGLALIGATLAWYGVVHEVRGFDADYDPAPIQAAWRKLQTDGAPPPVRSIVLEPALERNDALARGASQALCYQPMFGYRLERMPVAPLRLGPTLAEAAPGVLNVKNPACYVYPAANACRPGDHFAASARPAAERFLRYEAFPFQRPGWQVAADAVTLLALVLCAACLLVSALARRTRR